MSMYTVVFDNVSVSAAQDLLELTPADDKPIRLVSMHLSNVGGTADAGDAAEEFLRLQIIRGHTTTGSGGTAPTPRLLGPGNTTAGFTAEVNNTTIASAGTTQQLWADGFNVRLGYERIFLPEARPGANQGNTTLVVRLPTAPADAISISGTFVIEELD